MSAEYRVIRVTDQYEIGVRGGLIVAACRCGDGISVPDKGLGRAVISTWRTRHQNCVGAP